MTDTCQICIESFNKSTRFKVECFNCNYIACRKCIRQFVLLDINIEAVCMNCKIPWNDKFVGKQLLRAFFLKDYRTHINNMAVQQQLALLPDSQPEAERIKVIKNINKEIYKLSNLIYSLNKDIAITLNTVKKNFVEKWIENIKQYIEEQYNLEKLKPKKERKTKKQFNTQFMKTKTDIIQQNMEEILKQFEETEIYIIQKNAINKREELVKEKTIQEKKKNKVTYNRPCGKFDCNGMLQQNKSLCGLCNYITCKKCLVAYKKDEKHECNKEDIDTAELIKRDTKYCPKCNFGITKIDGCDVMFCTQCTTSFHWKTLAVLTKNLHNPHYIEYLRNNGTTQQRENMIINCTANPTITNFDMNRFRSIYRFCIDINHFNEYSKYANIGMQIVYKILHYNNVLDDFQIDIRSFENTNQKARINLLLNKIDKNEFTNIIKFNNMQSRFKEQCKQIIQTIVTVGIDLFFHYSNNEMMALNNIIRNLIDTHNINELKKKDLEFFNTYFSISTLIEMKEKLTTINNSLNEVIDYCKKESNDLSKLYNIKSGLSSINIILPF